MNGNLKRSGSCEHRYLVVLIIGLLFGLTPPVSAQTFVYRIDPTPVMTTAGTVPYGGFPAAYMVPGATIKLCTNSTCTALATAYTNATGSTACATGTPVTLPGTSVCTATAGSQGQFGFWVQPGTYYYTVTTATGTFGPYPLSSPTVGTLGGPGIVSANQSGGLNPMTSNLDCSLFTGASASLKITACANGLPSTGGTANSLNIQGAQTWNTDAFSGISKTVDLPCAATTYTVSTNSTIPSNVHLMAGEGCQFSVSGGVTLTINGSLDGSSLSQHFTGAGAVVISGMPAIFPQWFAGSDTGAKIAAALTAVPATGGVVDARGFTGSQNATQNIWNGIPNTKPATLLTAAGMTLHSTATQRPASSNLNWIGYGTTLSFEPTAPFVGGVNDRAIWASPDSSTITGPFNAAAPAINAGATSFNAAAAGDVSSLVAGDWLQLYQFDAVVGDVVIFDWMQVSGVAGTTVSMYSPFRTTFPAVGSGGHAVTQFSIIHAADVLENVNVQGITCTTTDAANAFPCFASGNSRNVAFDHVVSNPKLGNAIYSYRTAGLKFTNSTQLSDQTQASEIAESVDVILTGNTFRILNAVPNTSALTLDLGTGYFSVAHNVFYPCGQICVQMTNGVHDGQFVDNNLGYVYSATSGIGIAAVGVQHVTVSGNSLVGAMGGATTGMIFESTTGLTVDITSKGNVIGPNIINGFTVKYGARLTTDLYIVTYDTNEFEINGPFETENTVSTQTSFQTHVTGEAVQRYLIKADGTVVWTDAGASGTDFTLNRGSSGVAEFSKNLKVDGYTQLSNSPLTLVNGANSDVDFGTREFIVINGPTGVFSVTGFANGVDGRRLYLFNNVAFAMTITNEATSSATNRITTLTGADVTLRAGKSFATFVYNGATSRWILMSTN